MQNIRSITRYIILARAYTIYYTKQCSVHVPQANCYYQAQESDPFIHHMIDINYRNTIGDLSDPQLDSRWRDMPGRVKQDRESGDALKGKSLSSFPVVGHHRKAS